jgi:hypothetical protein
VRLSRYSRAYHGTNISNREASTVGCVHLQYALTLLCSVDPIVSCMGRRRTPRWEPHAAGAADAPAGSTAAIVAFLFPYVLVAAVRWGPFTPPRSPPSPPSAMERLGAAIGHDRLPAPLVFVLLLAVAALCAWMKTRTRTRTARLEKIIRRVELWKCDGTARAT